MPDDFAPPSRNRLFAARHLAIHHALDSLRIEKAYRHWHHDIIDEDSPMEAGFDFILELDKLGGFIDRETVLRQREQGLAKRLVQFKLRDPEPLFHHNEPI